MNHQRQKALIAEILDFIRRIGDAYPDDPGMSDLDDEQPVSITLGDVRRAWAIIAEATGETRVAFHRCNCPARTGPQGHAVWCSAMA